MANRINETTIFDTTVRNIQRNRRAVAALQEQVSSGKRINSLGDGAGDAVQVLSLGRTIARVEQYQRNIDAARGLLEPSEAALGSITGILTRLRELAVGADTETDQFGAIQAEVEQLHDEILQIANTRVGSRFLFGGYATDSAPFTKTGDFAAGVVAPPPDVTYGGDHNVLQIDIGEASRIDATLPGDAVFQGDVDGDGTFPDAGRADLFAIARDLRNALAAGDGDAIFASIGQIDDALEQVVQARGVIGARLNRLDVTEAQLADLKITLVAQRSDLEDVDSIEAITRLANQQNTLEASLAVSTRVLQTSLIDFLR
jgi:flagellar hook-associated protein 3 FlgL